MAMGNINKIALFLPLLIICTISLSCGSSKNPNNNFVFEKKPPFKLENAYFQKWAAGVKEGGSGINVFVNFEEMPSDVVVQNIYFRNHILEAKNSLDNPESFTATWLNEKKDDSYIMDSNPLAEAKNTPSNHFPFSLDDDQAVISYWHGGERHYFKIKHLSERHQLNYPQAPTQN